MAHTQRYIHQISRTLPLHGRKTGPCSVGDLLASQLLFSGSMLTSCGLLFAKTSIFLLFHQIFEIRRSMRVAIRIGIAVTVLITLAFIPVNAVLLAPRVGETWTHVLLSGRPNNWLIWGIGQATAGMLLDLFIFVLPIPAIMKLQLSTKKKIQLIAVFITALL